jgi:hypothetical protein
MLLFISERGHGFRLKEKGSMRTTVILGGVMCAMLARGCTSRSTPTPEFSNEEYNRYQDAKQAGLERLLGPMHNLVGHALVPFGVTGGSVDLYYFPNGIPGTAFATMELIEPDGRGPLPNWIGTYELVTFTKLKVPAPGGASREEEPFNQMERRMCHIMTAIGLYSHEAVLNPGETCEVPDEEGKPHLCLIFDEYRKDGVGLEIDGSKHCLLLCIEVFRSEMQYAMRHGSAAVLQKLKEAGYYPYSDLDRNPVF